MLLTVQGALEVADVSHSAIRNEKKRVLAEEFSKNHLRKVSHFVLFGQPTFRATNFINNQARCTRSSSVTYASQIEQMRWSLNSNVMKKIKNEMEIVIKTR